jgi:hypothetical protein
MKHEFDTVESSGEREAGSWKLEAIRIKEWPVT